MSKKIALFVFTLLLMPTLALSQDIHDGESLLRAMHSRYESTWYRTLTFTQKSTTYKPDGSSSAETWHEAALLPGKLRIDIGPLSAGNGYVLVEGNVTVIKDNKIASSRPLVNILLVLGFDVYTQDPAKTSKIVKEEGYDLTKLREDTWDGHPAYVVGAEKGDLKSRQFWVAKDTLLFLRDIEPAHDDPAKLNDIRFTDYRRLEGGWVAAGVEVYSNDKKVFTEEYSEIRANVDLSPSVFDPQQFQSTHWEK